MADTDRSSRLSQHIVHVDRGTLDDGLSSQRSEWKKMREMVERYGSFTDYHTEDGVMEQELPIIVSVQFAQPSQRPHP